MIVYADTSALVKLYIFETGSDAVARFVKRRDVALVYTPLHDIELRNAFFLRVFYGMDRSQARRCSRRLDEDLSAGRYLRVTATLDDLAQRCATVSASLTERVGCRALDVMHVSAALAAESASFVTYDRRQSALAQEAGLTCIDLGGGRPPELST